MEWHPYAKSYPLMSEVDPEGYKALKENIKAVGVQTPILYRMHKGKKQYIDGRNRAKACRELKVECPEAEIGLLDNQVQDFIDSMNLHRRHLDQDTRKAVAGRMRANGESIRTIATQLGVPKSTIARDLEGSTVPNGTVKGKDGRTQPAKRLCDRCKRVGETRNCQACADLKRKGKTVIEEKEDKEKRKTKAREHSAEKDRHGSPIPKGLLDAWNDPLLRDILDTAGKMLDSLLAAKIYYRLQKKGKHFPFVIVKDVEDGLTFVQNYLDQVCEHVRDNMPDAVCPTCHGVGCGDCRQGGLVPERVYEELLKTNGNPSAQTVPVEDVPEGAGSSKAG